MKKKIILSTVMLSLLVSPIISANNVKQNNNDIKSHQQIEKSIKQKQAEEASKQKQTEKASKQKQAEKTSKQKQTEKVSKENNKSNLNENRIANILNSNQLYKLSNYTTLYGKYGDPIIVFSNQSELNKFNKVVNKIENEDCYHNDQFNYLVNYLNNHHGMAKFFNSQNQNIIINTYHNYNTDRVIIHEFKKRL